MLKLFTIIGGHELIAKVVSGELTAGGNSPVTISHPLVIRPIQKAPGQYALDLFPHSLANPDGDHEINTGTIVTISKVIPKMLEDAYLERTSSIILASAMDEIERKFS